MWSRLAEPIGLLYRQDARDAIYRGIGLPLMGGDVAFTHVRLIDEAYTSPIMKIDAVPSTWQDVLIRFTTRPALFTTTCQKGLWCCTDAYARDATNYGYTCIL